MRPGLPRPGLRIGVSVRPPLPMRAPPKLPPMWPPRKPPLATRPPPKPPPNPLASAVVEARFATAIVAAVARAKVRVSLRDMVVLRGLGLSRISVPIPIGRSSREKVQTQHKKFARHLSPCTPLAPHHTDLKPVFVAASEAWRGSAPENAPQ